MGDGGMWSEWARLPSPDFLLLGFLQLRNEHT